MCKVHYYNCILNKHCFNSTFDIPTFTPFTITQFKTHLVTKSMGRIDTEFQKLYKILTEIYCRIQKIFYQSPTFFITKKISITVKEKLQTYCATTHARSGGNHMWILKTSNERFINIKSQNLSKINNVKTYYFSTLYTTITHNRSKTMLLT